MASSPRASNQKKPFVLGISGCSCAGMTRMAFDLVRVVCGPSVTSEPSKGKHHRVERFFAEAHSYRVSVICQDWFFKSASADGGCLPWDEAESLDHNSILDVLNNEISNESVDLHYLRRPQSFP